MTHVARRSRSAAVLELRQYTTRPGGRDALIDLFERSLIEGQEAVGATIVGHFRDLDRPDRFVWLRGFADMAARHAALTAFYGGPVWAAHRNAANAAMLDHTDVLLLRPARVPAAFPPPRPAATASASGRLIAAVTVPVLPQAADRVADVFDRVLAPALRQYGTEFVAAFVTEPAANDYPALPVREGEHVMVWFLRSADEALYAQLAASAPWRAGTDMLRQIATAPVGTLRLGPAPGSALA